MFDGCVYFQSLQTGGGCKNMFTSGPSLLGPPVVRVTGLVGHQSFQSFQSLGLLAASCPSHQKVIPVVPVTGLVGYQLFQSSQSCQSLGSLATSRHSLVTINPVAFSAILIWVNSFNLSGLGDCPGRGRRLKQWSDGKCDLIKTHHSAVCFISGFHIGTIWTLLSQNHLLLQLRPH